jgi:outer membrane protein OmpU
LQSPAHERERSILNSDIRLEVHLQSEHEGKTMKKVLFATTALVATAGVASADIALSGVAQMGIQGGSGGATTQFVQDIDITFTMSGTADNGTTFGAAIDLDENAAGVGTNDAASRSSSPATSAR